MKFIKSLLFPPIALTLVLLPISIVLLVYSMIFSGTKSPIAIFSYVLAFYTLTLWVLKTPQLIKFFRNLKYDNRFLKKWFSDARLRVNVSLYGALFFNVAYGLLQLGLGFWHKTFWYHSLAGYYICLALMRFFLISHLSKNKAGENLRAELIRYRRCGIVFLTMNLALSLIVFFMVYWNRTFVHHEITAISMATYTFTALTLSIINVIRYRRYESPVYSASKIIGLTSALVSMLTLSSTLLTTFGNGSMSPLGTKILLASVGSAICLFVILLAVYMIVTSTKKLKEL